MTDRPILFSAPMVRALLDGRKRQTRRLAWQKAKKGQGPQSGWKYEHDGKIAILLKPTIWQKVRPEDRLWVKETWCDPEDNRRPVYRADLTPGQAADADRINRICRGLVKITQPWRSSRFMFRWASRLTLPVTAVKIERLQEITNKEAIKEGLRREPMFKDRPEGPFWRGYRWDQSDSWMPTPKGAFQYLWSSLHGPDAWDDNPEVVAISFRVVKANIDAQERVA